MKSRRQIILDVDVDSFIKLMEAEGHGTPTREVAEAAIHKARCLASWVPKDKQDESKSWLKARGMGVYAGEQIHE